jgi:hypothetical protein
MKILIACEESQTVAIQFRKLGHEAFSCDIIPCSGGYPEWHIKDDVLKHLEGWDMIIAFPPCTHLAVSGARHFAKKITDGRQQQGIDFFMAIVNAPCAKIAIENPIGIMSNLYRKPDQIVQPYMFGDPVKKSTCLWLKGVPILKPTNNVESDVKYYTYPGSDKKMSDHSARQIIVEGKKCGYHTDEFKKHRSKTFRGIARAMAHQWNYVWINNTQQVLF